ncbi:hypothetical protein [Solilutibacter pythonis]|uniref:hypothetical protein n=1 Tax=Solilutibacter pythonis TaxID=2483112 RepID=UPI001FEAD343|nr:hypothetical protein [Lysobacter pythonis]
MNRGRVANEVAIAQAVSLNSWVTQINVSTANIQKVSRFIPYVGQAIAAALQAADRVIRQIRTGLRTGSNFYITTLDVANTLYARAAYAAVKATGGASAIQTAYKVAKDNSPNATLRPLTAGFLTSQLLAAERDYLNEFNVPAGRNRRSEGGERYRNVVMESRDKFTRERRDNWLILDANGGTDLVDYDRWAAVDVFEINLFLFRIPVGWGGAQAVSRGQPRFFPGIHRGSGWRSEYEGRRYRPYNGVSRRSIAGMLIESDPGGRLAGGNKSQAYFRGYRNGLAHRYHDVKRDKARTPGENTRNAGPYFTIEVQNAIANARTSSKLNLTTGRLDVPEQARGNQLRALATAQVYFNRPHEYSRFARRVWGRADGKYEMGSLFSPYWQVRLIETPLHMKAQLAAVP